MGWVILVIAAAGVAGYLRQPMFGRLPDKISLAKMKKSAHWQHGHFRNIHPTPQMTGEGGFFATMYDFYFKKHPHTKPEQPLPVLKYDIKAEDKNKDLLIWFGHSSYYIQLGGKSFLVDPVFSANASPLPHNVVPFLGTDVYTPEDMPKVDGIIITHDHYDHLDYATVKKLRDKVKRVVVPLGVGAHFRRWGYRPEIIEELDWDEELSFENGRIVCLPARHFSGRMLPYRSLWASFLLEIAGYRLYIGGDSGYDDHYRQIGERFAPIDLALLECGQYDANWRFIHQQPEEGFKAAEDLRAKRVFLGHNSKFCICNHPWREPLDKAAELAKESKVKLITPQISEAVNLRDETQQFTRWWKDCI
ncbi:MAG: MBL fold metallo-hydrolase [Alphaproteobacteria bacterium]|nr:MBL fold metallo-hydrolase [Alphaproteobacteria bacterium]